MGNHDPNKGSLLIVGEDASALFFLTKIFQSKGYITLTAQSETAALRFVEDCPSKIDMIIMDLDAPNFDYVQLVGKLKDLGNASPYVALSSSHEVSERVEICGFKAVFKKPYSLDDLYDKINHMLHPNEVPEIKEPAFPSGTKPSAKILIVDDELDVCHMIGEALFEDFPDSDFRVRGVTSGAEAIKVSKEFQPDIAIIDIRMPGMSGDELIQRMKFGEGYCPRDFVIYTGVSDEASLNRWQSMGHRVLSKPSNIEMLHDVLKRICMRHHLLKKT